MNSSDHCSAIAPEMYVIFRENEARGHISADFLARHTFIKEALRAKVLNWLSHVHRHFDMAPETAYLSRYALDRYLENHPSLRCEMIQPVALGALLAVAKLEEGDRFCIGDMMAISLYRFDRRLLLRCEREVLLNIDYELLVPTVYTFLCRYLKAAGADLDMVHLACYWGEWTQHEYALLQFLPSLSAATVVHLCLRTLDRAPWSPTLLQYTQYDEADLQDCCVAMRAVLQRPAPLAVRQKYSEHFGQVAIRHTVTAA
jgi:hypothetical protein